MVDKVPNWIKEISDDKERADELYKLCVYHHKQFDEEKNKYDKLYAAYNSMIEKCMRLEGLK